MYKIIKFLNKHGGGAVLVAVFFGFLVVLPTLTIVFNLGDDFKGIYPSFSSTDEYYYQAKVKEISEGNGLGNIYIKENKNQPYMNSMLAEYVLAKISTSFNLPVPKLFAINDFILPILLFLLIYTLFFVSGKNKLLALIFSTIFCLIFIGTIGRPINPQFSFLFFITSVILLWKIYKEEEFKKQMVYNFLLGINFAVLLYMYPYFWTALLAVYFIILIYNLTKKRLYDVLAFAITAIPLSVPYFINTYNASLNPFYAETIARMGLFHSYFPGSYYNVAPVVVTMIFIFFLRKKIRQDNLSFSFFLLIAALLVNWQNIFTGKYILFATHYIMVTAFLVFWSIFLIFSGINKLVFKQKFLIITCLILPLTFLFFRNFNEMKYSIFTKTEINKYRQMQKLSRLFDWLNNNTLKNSVIYIVDNAEKENLFPVYTHNNLYSNSFSGVFLMSDIEMERRWVRNNIFRKSLTAEEIEFSYWDIWVQKFLDSYKNRETRKKLFGLLGIRLAKERQVPLENINRVLSDFNQVKKNNPIDVIKEYEADYIIINNDFLTGTKDKIKNTGKTKHLIDIYNYSIYKIL